MGSKPYQNFIDRLDNKEPLTKNKYIRDFAHYLKFLKVKDPNSLLTKRFYSPLELESIENKIIKFITYQKNQGLNHSTIKGRKFAIEFFYLANRINLNWKHISGYIPRPDKAKEDQPYTTEDIQKMLEVANGERDRFMLYLLSSTGMRIGALPDLKIKDIEAIKPEGYHGKHLYKIIVYRGHRSQYYTFTSFECAEALDSYLEFRKRNEEEITENSPLLRNAVNSTLPNVKRNKVKPLRTFVDSVYRIASKAGIRQRTHDTRTRHKHMLDHAFRKFTNTKMIEAGVDHNTKEFLFGHKISRGLDNSYDRTPTKIRLKEYLKAIELLTISTENRLRKQVAEQEHTIQVKIAQKDQQIQTLIKRIAVMEQTQQQEIKNWKRTQKELQELLQDGGAELKRKLLEEES
ncbi:MAG: site-specific integrase [Nitrososphaeraceae archaeon]